MYSGKPNENTQSNNLFIFLSSNLLIYVFIHSFIYAFFICLFIYFINSRHNKT